ncbi:HD domain-containing protein [Clostridium sp.]|uniref:HD domain-containing protein n=1 Tax=Clostridium sp. TaxID=1506 RepID=UPI0034648ED6
MDRGNYIVTYTGTKFYPLDPRREEIKDKDISHSLSMLCRGNGHYKHFYSVAQHSIYCAREAKALGFSKRVQLACLLHDGSEAYISDITRPVKVYLDSYREIEDKLQSLIYKSYGLELTEEEFNEMSKVDDIILSYELRNLLTTESMHKTEQDVSTNYDLSLRDMQEVETEFLELLKELTLK